MADAREASPHQNAGSRMGLAVFETNLHEIGFKRGERALEPATERGHGLARGGDPRRAGGASAVPAGAARRRAPSRSSLSPRPMHLGGGGKFPGKSQSLGAAKPPRPQFDRLDGFLPAMTGERAADENDRREPVDQTEL